MSANSAQVVLRANLSSPFNAAIKQRSSNSGLRGNAFLYQSETNTVNQARSKVRIVSTTNPGFSRTMRIPLSRHGLLQRLVLHATWNGHAVSPSGASNHIGAVPNLGVAFCSEYRIVCEGQTIARLDSFGVLTNLYCNSSNEDLVKHQVLLEGYDDNTGALTAQNCKADKDGIYGGNHWAGTTADDLHTYFDMPWWFSKKQNLVLDLGVLANQVYLECDVEASANCFKKTGTATVPTLGELEVIQYITELSPDATKVYRSAQYSLGSPLTEIVFNTTHSIVASAISHTADATAFSVRLNQFSGQVKKLIVFAVVADDYATNHHRLRPIALNNLKLKASGTDIWELEDMEDKEQILESVINGTRWCGGENTRPTCVTGSDKITFGVAGDVAAVDNIGSESSGHTAAQLALANGIIEEYEHRNDKFGQLKNFAFDPQNVYCVDFSSIYDYSAVSANGSVDMAQLNSAELSGTIPSSAKGYNQHTLAHGAAVKVDIHVIAYNETLLSYITNSAGSTMIRMIES